MLLTKLCKIVRQSRNSFVEIGHRLRSAEGLTFSWSTEMRAAYSNTVLRCSRTLLLRSSLVVASSRYLCREAFQRKRHSPPAGRFPPLRDMHDYPPRSRVHHKSLYVRKFFSQCLQIMQIGHAGIEGPKILAIKTPRNEISS